MPLTLRILAFGAVRVDMDSGLATGPGMAFTLPPLELALLRYLRDRPGQVVPRDELLRAVWGHKACVVTRAVDTTVSRLRRRLGPEGAARIRAIHGEGYTLEGGPRAMPSSQAPVPTATRLVGRSEDLAMLLDWASRPGARWMTVLGPRGIGKSRLLAELWRSVHEVPLGTFPDGVTLVPLEQAEAPEDVAGLLCGALGLRPATLGSFPEFLCSSLGSARCLLLLDSVDRARSALAALQPALARCPGVVVVASGREPLGCEGEEQHLLAPLDAGAAAALFAEASGGGTTDLAPVGGLPLGIMLFAAAWRAGVDLARAASDGVGAAVQASWGRLPTEARRVLARLSVFRDPFHPAAAAAVADASSSTLDLLARESLLQLHGQTRSLHPAIRAFAAEQLDAGDRETVEDRHMDWALGLVAPEGLSLRGAARLECRRQALGARADIEAAWSRAIRREHGDRLARSAPGLRSLWMSGGLVRSAALLLRAAREQATHPEQHVELCLAEAACLGRLGEGRQARDLLRSVSPDGLPATLAARLSATLAEAALGLQSDAEQMAVGDEALGLADRWLPSAERCQVRCSALAQRARANLACPSLADAHALLLEARASADPDLVSAALFVHGVVRFRWSPSRAALHDLRSARRLQEIEGDEAALAVTLVWETTVAHVIGAPDEAAHVERTAEALLERHGALQLLWAMRRNLGLAAVAHGRFEVAEPRLRQCIAATERLGLGRLHAHCHESLALCLVQAGRPEEALAELDACLAHRGTDYVSDGQSWWIRALAHIDQPEEADRTVREGLRCHATAPSWMPEVTLDLQLLGAVARARLSAAGDPWPLLVDRLLAARTEPASRGVALWLAAQVAAERDPPLAGRLFGYAAAVEPFRAATASAYAQVRARIAHRLGDQGLAEAEAEGTTLSRAGLGRILRRRAVA